jgi:hypothetical protein
MLVSQNVSLQHHTGQVRLLAQAAKSSIRKLDTHTTPRNTSIKLFRCLEQDEVQIEDRHHDNVDRLERRESKGKCAQTLLPSEPPSSLHHQHQPHTLCYRQTSDISQGFNAHREQLLNPDLIKTLPMSKFSAAFAAG